MVAIKPQSVQRFLADPDRQLSAFLFHGTDPGLVSERAHKLARLLAERESPPGELIRLDDADLDGDRDRLGVELRTLPMFGGRKVVRVTTGRIINATMLKELVEAGDLAGVLVVEAGNLKATDTLRAAFEKSAVAASVACYADEARDLEGVVREVLDAAGLAIAPDARALLVSRLGADRALSRAEVEKLALYAQGKAHGGGTIDADDVDAIVGDAAELAVDRIVNAAAGGDAAGAVNELSRAVNSGESAQMVILALLRHLHRLHRIRAEMDRGAGLDEALRQLRPPLHFKARDAFTAQLRRWTVSALDRAIAATADALKSARLTSALEEVVAERLLLSLASQARG
ncbi:MAG: DNA polymerase III subunit delta [Hyphomicrobiaceae bacterium]|nr:DNA polymerase III subunit delta [Hyphomicrobiaceae bacterium]